MSDETIETIEAFVALHAASRRRALPKEERRTRDALDEQLRDLIDGARPAPRSIPNPSPAGAEPATARRVPAATATPAVAVAPVMSAPPPAGPGGAPDLVDGLTLPSEDARRLSRVDPRERPSSSYTPSRAPTFLDAYYDGVVDPADRPPPDVAPSQVVDALGAPVDLSPMTRDLWGVGTSDLVPPPAPAPAPAPAPSVSPAKVRVRRSQEAPEVTPKRKRPGEAVVSPVTVSAATSSPRAPASAADMSRALPVTEVPPRAVPPGGAPVPPGGAPVPPSPAAVSEDLALPSLDEPLSGPKTAPLPPTEGSASSPARPAALSPSRRSPAGLGSAPSAPAAPPWPSRSHRSEGEAAAPVIPDRSADALRSGPGSSPDVEDIPRAPSLPPVIVHLRGGQTFRGFVERFEVQDGRVLVRGREPDNAAREIRLDDVLLIFFARRREDPPSPKEGQKLEVSLANGKRVAGFSPDYTVGGNALTVVPSTDRGGVDRIWIPARSVKAIVLD